jgi:hypothetical protein
MTEKKNPRAKPAKPDKFDMRGKTPESWLCIDCGRNTAPGHPDRKTYEGLLRRATVIGKLEGTGNKTTVYNATVNSMCEIYTVRESVWKAAGMEPMGGSLCIGCLEARLGRDLTWRDFSRHIFNTFRGPSA